MKLDVETFAEACAILTRPTLGAVRAQGARIRAAISTDPQARALWEIRVAVAELQRFVDRGDRVDEMRAHLRRALAVAEHEWTEEELRPTPATEGTSRWWAEHDRRLEEEGLRMAALARATVETP